MGERENTVKTVVGIFQRRQNQLRGTFREIGVRVPPQLRESMRATLKRIREIALFTVDERPELDPKDIVKAIDKANRTQKPPK